MFIGEGPGREEEDNGRPFIGKSGTLLRSIIDRLNIPDIYITNIVSCRSCEPVLDENGLPRMFRQRNAPSVPMYKDIPPLPLQWKACLPRLQEEIYLVDPIIIVSLGNTAAEALTGGHVTITRDRGTEVTIEIPGAGHRAVLTEKKQVWTRKVGGEVVTPTEQAMVQYLMIPTFHPSYVARLKADHGPTSPFQLLIGDIKKAVSIYDLYMQEIHGRLPSGRPEISNDDVINSYESGDTE